MLFIFSEQPVLPVGSVHINQLIAKRKAEKEGRELITDKWRLVVTNSRLTVEIVVEYSLSLSLSLSPLSVFARSVSLLRYAGRAEIS